MKIRTEKLIYTMLSVYAAATFISQLPHHGFNRLGSVDKYMLLPNWRFFAPIPATHDYSAFHRLIFSDGGMTPWMLTRHPSGRQWKHIFWFPGRRQEKGIFDYANELVPLLATHDDEIISSSVPYRLLRNHINKLIVESSQADVDGFQFCLAKHAGYDDHAEPEILMTSGVHTLK